MRKTPTESEKFQILAVIYDLDFIFRVRNAFSTEPGVDLHVCRSAEEAKLLLRGVGIYGNRLTYALPQLILLDTMTPDDADAKLLEHLRATTDYPNIPVVLLAGVTGQSGLQELLDQGANAVIVKRDSAEEMLTIFRGIRAWDGLKTGTSSLEGPSGITHTQHAPERDLSA